VDNAVRSGKTLAYSRDRKLLHTPFQYRVVQKLSPYRIIPTNRTNRIYSANKAIDCESNLSVEEDFYNAL